MKKINWKYALGEIIIVIIGITIAFSLNNWKEENKNRKLKKQYLESLQIDIEKEIEQLKANDTGIVQRIDKIERVLHFIYKNEGEASQVFRYVFEVAKIVSFNPENSTYQTMINSGLTQAQLGAIWTLSDIDKDGCLGMFFLLIIIIFLRVI